MTVIAGATNLKSAQGEYNFAVDGGATGTITLRQGGGNTLPNLIPAGAIVVGGYVEVDTACLSATGTIAVQVEAAGDIVAAAGQASWTVGRKSVLPAFTGASTVKTTVNRSIQIVIGAAAFTAGKFRVVLYYR